MMFVLTEWNACEGLFNMLCVTDMHDLPPYEALDTLAKRRSIACKMFIFDVF
jgi:hypothetical protein